MKDNKKNCLKIKEVKDLNDLFEGYNGDCKCEEWDTGMPVGKEVLTMSNCCYLTTQCKRKKPR